ncbi:MAG: ubiquitin family protein [Oscillospiraceae bacterium]|nr:ubiquitin family protein [Oscillospiraceae bacterium]
MLKQGELIALSEEELELVIGGVDPGKGKEISVRVELPSGDVVEIQCLSDITVEKFLEKIADVWKGSVSLTFGMHFMQDERTLYSYEVHNGNLISASPIIY